MDLVAGYSEAFFEANSRCERCAGGLSLTHGPWGSLSLLRGNIPLLFTDNETNNERIFGRANGSPYVKDGINNYVVNGNQEAVNPEKTGTKSSAHYEVNVGTGKTVTIRLRLSDLAPAAMGDPFKKFAEIMQIRQREETRFLRIHHPEGINSEDRALVMRQALAGMLWSKQFFFFDVDLWLVEHGKDPVTWGPTLCVTVNGST